MVRCPAGCRSDHMPALSATRPKRKSCAASNVTPCSVLSIREVRSVVDRARTGTSWLARWNARRRLVVLAIRILDPLLDELERLRAALKLADEKARRLAASAWDRGLFAGENFARAKTKNRKAKPPRNPFL